MLRVHDACKSARNQRHCFTSARACKSLPSRCFAMHLLPRIELRTCFHEYHRSSNMPLMPSQVAGCALVDADIQLALGASLTGIRPRVQPGTRHDAEWTQQAMRLGVDVIQPYERPDMTGLSRPPALTGLELVRNMAATGTFVPAGLCALFESASSPLMPLQAPVRSTGFGPHQQSGQKFGMSNDRSYGCMSYAYVMVSHKHGSQISARYLPDIAKFGCCYKTTRTG